MKLTAKLDKIAEDIRLSLESKDRAREKALPLSRDAIRSCANAIRAVHRHEFAEAKEMLASARKMLREARVVVKECGELANTGFIRDAEKEYAEGSAVLALVTGRPVPHPDKLRVDHAAYLNGLGEAVGELRRYILDGLRKGDTGRGEELLLAMDDIYNILVTMDFPDALTGGLRRTTDNVRGILEKTRGDLTLMLTEKNLEAKLTKLKGKISPSGD
ncbi:MAG: haloacid dehalogenase [Chloroflexota bacterium]